MEWNRVEEMETIMYKPVFCKVKCFFLASRNPRQYPFSPFAQKYPSLSPVRST